MKLEEYLKKYSPKTLEHAVQVEKLSLMLFKQLAPNLGLNLDTKLLSLGAMLHDVGMSVDSASHNKIAAKMLLKEGIFGLNKEEVRTVACLVRYHRGSCPKASHGNFSKLNPSSQYLVKVFGGIIKLCDALDWKHQNFTQELSVNIKDKTAFLTLKTTSNIIIKTGFLKFFSKKKDLFEKTFGVRVCILGE